MRKRRRFQPSLLSRLRVAADVIQGHLALDFQAIDSGRVLDRGFGSGRHAGERRLPGLAETSLQREGNGSIDLRGGDIGRGVEVDVERQVVLVLKAADFEGAEGFVGLDLGTLALPAGSGPEAGSSLLQGVEKQSGAPVIDAVVGEGVDYLLNASLHGVHVVENGHLETAGIVAVQTSASRLYTAGAGVQVEVAITLVAKSGRTAVDAIFHEMVAGTVGHESLLKMG
jgi:hypothetical protein